MSIQDRFEIFHAANPHIYVLFRRFVREARIAGFNKYSARAIIHRIRWHLDVEITPTDDAETHPFKINDHFSSRYARLMVALNPSFEGFFELRELKTE